MADAIRLTVTTRAEHRCEYCQLRDEDDAFAFHVEHIIALKHGGSHEVDNLAYACQNCNLHKGSNLAGIDPETNVLVPLFNPRQQQWVNHFAMAEFRLVGRTPTGRATVLVLAMNDPDRVQLRAILASRNV